MNINIMYNIFFCTALIIWHISLPASAIFTENKGQIHDQYYKPRPDVLFSGSANGLYYHLKKDGLHYQLFRVESWKKENNKKHLLPEEKKDVPDQISIYRVDVNWLNTSPATKIIREKELSGYTNYYNVPENTEPALFVKSYESIRYQNIYNGIDLHFYSNEGNLEYDFIVQPNADYRQIKIQINGAELKVSDKKELIIKTPFGDIVEGALKAYQGNKKISADWLVQDNVVSFHIQNYDKSKPLRIDPPVRIWGTYYGTEGQDYGWACAVDHYKRSYLAGNTESTANIATTGAHQTTFSGNTDGFLAAFSEWGTRRWATYFGGTETDDVTSCEALPAGEAVVAGYTSSTTGIATAGSFQPTNADGGIFEEGFLALFDTSGILRWGTYVGGSWQDRVNGIAIDDSLHVYITGYTQSSDNIATNTTHDGDYNGSLDAFIMRFDTAGNRQWGTYYGGANDDEATDIKVRNNKLVIAGYTNSTSDITFLDYYDNTLSGPTDIFLAIFRADFGILNWSTYYGGTVNERDARADIDSTNNIYLAGVTSSLSDIATSNSFKPTTASNQVDDMFLVKFNSSYQREWATYYGGASSFEATRFCRVDYQGNIYIGGYSGSSSDIASSNGYKPFKDIPSLPIYNDAFIAKFRPNGTRIWGTYYGGRDQDFGEDLALDTAGNIFLAGYTYSLDFIASENFSFSQTYSGSGRDAFLVRFNNEAIDLPPVSSAVYDISENDNSFTTYPNPASNQLNVFLKNGVPFIVNLFDVTGRCIFQSVSPSVDVIHLDISHYDNGIYFIEAKPTQGDKIFTQKIIIQKQ